MTRVHFLIFCNNAVAVMSFISVILSIGATYIIYGEGQPILLAITLILALLSIGCLIVFALDFSYSHYIYFEDDIVTRSKLLLERLFGWPVLFCIFTEIFVTFNFIYVLIIKYKLANE